MPDNFLTFNDNLSQDFHTLRKSVDDVYSSVGNGTELLDELVQVIADTIPKAQPNQNPLLSGILNMLIPSTQPSVIHGETQTEREIYEVENNKTQETENELS